MNRRGLTLLETLLAAILLAVAAVMLVPVMQDIARPADNRVEPSVTLAELARFADATIAALPVDEFEDVLAWPNDPQWPPVRVSRLSSENTHDVWIVFSCDGWSAMRRVMSPPICDEAEDGEIHQRSPAQSDRMPQQSPRNSLRQSSGDMAVGQKGGRR
jgi:hypothetical protein